MLRLFLILAAASIIATGLLLSVAAWGVYRSLHVGRDAAALRDAAAPDLARSWQKQCEFSVGAVPLFLARFGLGFAPVPNEARQALGSIRSAEVAVYQTRERNPRQPLSEQFIATDQAMSARGWERLVGVLDRDQMVVIYVPRKMRSERELKFCLAVRDHSQLVVVAGGANLEPLLELAARRMPTRELAAEFGNSF